ncbi:MAG: AbgT family transporter [Phycisphaerae bacterium]|nr:MAG: AbgT family transporter [Planctomycetota bacterium]KAB2949800.1 MAG: AbgT family transporter [Phycisphaerae bacterium]MBE7456994.1 AbgT family transporter [Planctomycetia bacterium]MCK6463647.1 AbgT family transporter [Phycisphaerae bacterium]MCL4718316.1 AbgT family transporter [Phycisphaerae bacterium]
MTATTTSSEAQGALAKFLRGVERAGNALPHPATLFLLLALLVVLGSEIAVRAGVSAAEPGKPDVLVTPQSLLTLDGLHFMLTKMVTNFTAFAPLGTVLVSLLGIAVAEHSGLISAMMRLLVLSTPRKWLTPVVVFCGIQSNMASDVGYVLLIPLAGVIYHSVGRNPLLGLAAGFAGVSGGFSANLMLGSIDPLLSGLTQEAARILDPAAEVQPSCNYYFMFVSTFLLTAVGTWVTEKVIAPRLGAYQPDGDTAPSEKLEHLSTREKKALLSATVIAAVFGLVLLWSALPHGWLPGSGFLRDPKTGDLLRSPFMQSIVAFIFVGGVVCGVAYGWVAGTIRNDSDAMKGMGQSMSAMGSYLVLVFFAAQFVEFFKWTNLGKILAIEGAGLLAGIGFTGLPLLVCFIVLSMLVNLLMGSASAKWAFMAPVFVPMFMPLGIAPEETQLAYRIGDSCTNVISPGNSYLALIIAFFQRYDKKAGIGTMVATMLPYSIVFFVAWAIFMIAWFLLGIPIGTVAA